MSRAQEPEERFSPDFNQISLPNFIIHFFIAETFGTGKISSKEMVIRVIQEAARKKW